jgi:hypothetical protein
MWKGLSTSSLVVRLTCTSIPTNMLPVRSSTQTMSNLNDRRTLSIKLALRTSNAPANAIVASAQEAQIDLVVVGTHGRGAMAHLLLGDAAERVVRSAHCPVLTVRSEGASRTKSCGKR